MIMMIPKIGKSIRRSRRQVHKLPYVGLHKVSLAHAQDLTLSSASLDHYTQVPEGEDRHVHLDLSDLGRSIKIALVRLGFEFSTRHD